MADPGFIASQNFDAPAVVAEVTRGSAAEREGLAIGDVILAVNDQMADSAWEERLAPLRPGETLCLRVRNSQGAHELTWKLAAREQVEFELIDVDNISPQQKARRAAWLKGESQTSGETRP